MSTMEVVFSNITHKDGSRRSYVERFPVGMLEWKHLFAFLHKKTDIPVRYMILRCGHSRIPWVNKKNADTLKEYIGRNNLSDVGSVYVSLSTFVNADQYIFDQQVSLYRRLKREKIKSQMLYHMKHYSQNILNSKNPIIPQYNKFFQGITS